MLPLFRYPGSCGTNTRTRNKEALTSVTQNIWEPSHVRNAGSKQRASSPSAQPAGKGRAPRSRAVRSAACTRASTPNANSDNSGRLRFLCCRNSRINCALRETDACRANLGKKNTAQRVRRRRGETVVFWNRTRVVVRQGPRVRPYR